MDNANEGHTKIPLNSVTKIPVEWLTLDRRNPRLFPAGDQPNEVEIIAQLYRSEDLGELLQSIAANGYLDIEPLIVLEENDNLTVLEGNRRLAAIRLFEKPDLAGLINQQTRLKITIPSFPEKFRGTLQKVSVYRVGVVPRLGPLLDSNTLMVPPSGNPTQRRDLLPNGTKMDMPHLQTLLPKSATDTIRSSGW